MGTQSILIASQESYAQDFQNKLLKYSNNYYINKHYKVGEEVDRDKLKHAMIFNSLLCTDSCELVDWIVKKIDGTLEEKPKKRRKVTPKMIEECEDREELMKECCPKDTWEKAEW